jgi:hypothetical protein
MTAILFLKNECADAAEKSHCWRHNLKLVDQSTHTLLQDKEQGRWTCAHPEQGEAKERQKQFTTTS